MLLKYTFFYLILLDPAKSRKSPVDRNHDPGDKFGGPGKTAGHYY